MRAIFVALTVGLLVALGTIAPVAAASRVPKVVLVVGPVGSLTSYYRSLANDAAVVARKAGAEVVKVYSPNATWSAVKQAIGGASIVVYLGHGNGWPSRYRDSLFPPSQNGFGLNPIAGVDDSAHQYFGEASLDQVRLAPNAVVLLHHLCYASGNTEPGLPEGTLDQAVQRVDNYAAGFLRAGAKAVVAEAHLGPAYYVKQLLKTRLSIEQIWNRSPNANGHVIREASVRTPGYTARLDPDNTSSGFYRSLVSRGVTASDVRSSGTGTIGSASFVMPAVPSLAGAALKFGSIQLSGLPIAATSTRLTLPLTRGAMSSVPKGAQVGLRWDPILLDAQPSAAPATGTTSGAGTTTTGVAAPTSTDGTHGLFTPPSPSADPVPTDPATTDPTTSPAASDPAATPPATPAVTPAPTPEPAPVAIIPTEAPSVDLVVPEQTGTVVNLTAASRSKAGFAVAVTLPSAPGLYRLVPTLHTPSGIAYDAATQALLTPVLVRVSGSIAVAYGVPANTTIPAGAAASVPVRVVNTGSEAWDAPSTSGVPTDPAASPGTAAAGGTARLVATWISTTGNEVPAAETINLSSLISSPGSDLPIKLNLVAPATPGEYLIVLDVVSPSRGPLSAVGSAPGLIRVTVSDPGPSPTVVPPQRG